MDQKKTTIPSGLFMMDSGSAAFAAADEAAAADFVCKVLEKHGGKCRKREGNYLEYDFSGPWRNRFITAYLTPGTEGRWVADFKEANGSTSLRHYVLLLGTLVLMGLCAWWMRSWWSLLPALALIALYLWLNYAPEKASIRRMRQIREELGR